MPNHVKSRIEILGTKEQVKEVFNRFNTHVSASLSKAYDGSIICNDTNNKVDFSVGWLNLKTGIFTRRGEDEVLGLPDGWEPEIRPAFDHFPDFNKVLPQPDNIFNGSLGLAEEEMCRREGRPTWYSWNTENWGTKWNSYSNEKEADNVFTFETAWSSVIGLVEIMSRDFPDVEFLYEYADEDTGYNVGVVRLKNGIVDVYQPEGGSKEAYDIAFKLRPEYADGYVLVGDTYEYVDEDDVGE